MDSCLSAGAAALVGQRVQRLGVRLNQPEDEIIIIIIIHYTAIRDERRLELAHFSPYLCKRANHPAIKKPSSLISWNKRGLVRIPKRK